MIAFIKDEKGLKKVLKWACTYKANMLTVVSEHGLQFNVEGLSLSITKRVITEFIDTSLDADVMNHIHQFVKKWKSTNSPFTKKFVHLTTIGIEDSLSYTFASSLYNPLKKAIAVKNAVNTYDARLVYADEYFAPYCELAGIPIVYTAKKTHKGFVSYVKRRVAMAFWAIISFRSTLSVLIGFVLNIKVSDKIKESKLLFIGGAQSKTFYGIWDEIRKRCNKSSELFYALNIYDIRRFMPSRIKNNELIGFVEGFVGPKGFFRVCIKAAILFWTYCFSNIRHHVALSGKESPFFNALIDKTALRSIIYVLLFVESAESLANNGNLIRVIFSKNGLWSSVLSAVFKKQGIETIAITHGMVLDPTLYRTNASVKLTWGEFDSTLLRKYSSDEHFIHFKRPNKHHDSVTNIKDYRCIRIGPGSGKSSSVPVKVLNGLYVGILPTSTRLHSDMKRFLRLSMRFFIANRNWLDFDGVLIKLHPLSDVQKYIGLLRDLSVLPKDFPVFISQEGDLNWYVHKMEFALCYHSSPILSLLAADVPFCVFTYGSWLNKEFLAHFPSWMLFNSWEDLEGVRPKHINDFHDNSSWLRELYWGKTGLDEQAVAKRMLKGLLSNRE